MYRSHVFIEHSKSSLIQPILLGFAISIFIIFTQSLYEFGASIRLIKNQIINDMDYYLTYQVFSPQELIAMNEILKRDRENLLREISEIKQVTSETIQNSDPLKKTENAIIASVLSETNYNSLLIFHPHSVNVKKNDIVIDSQKNIIGMIVDAGEYQSRISLLSLPGYKTSGRITHSADTIDLLGAGNGTYITHIPREIQLAVGDTIESLEHPLYNIGVVADISFEERDPNKKVLINLPTSLDSTKYVEIISDRSKKE